MRRRRRFSSTALSELHDNLQLKLASLQKLALDLQQEQQRKELELIGGLHAKLRPIVQALAAEEGYTYVLDSSIVFAAPQADDLTAQLLRRWNKLYRGEDGKVKPAGKE